MALAARLFPRWRLSGPLPGGAARPRSPGRAEGRPPLAGLCCLCRRHLSWTTAPCPPASWASAASALPARDPRRPLLRPAGLPAALPALPAGPRRSYSSEEQPQQRQKTKVLILGFSNPVNWVRTRTLAFLIWAYFDKEFSIKEFSEGAKQALNQKWTPSPFLPLEGRIARFSERGFPHNEKDKACRLIAFSMKKRAMSSKTLQAFAHVSRLLSQCKFDLLEELVTKELLLVLKEKVTSLPDSHRDALAADMDEIVYTSTGDISIYYDDKGRKFVNILMCFWYLTSANIPSETLSGAGVFQVKLGNQNVETKQLLSASYEFQREFTQGVKPNWIIARIDHAKLLE